VLGAVAWLALVGYVFMMTWQRRPEVSVWRRPLYGNPLNLVLAPDLLTERGRVLRRRAGYALLVFLASLASGALLGLLVRD
jgi:hypothetical protein